MQNSQNNRILIVDDEAEIRAGYKLILSPQKICTLNSSRISSDEEKVTDSILNFDISEASNGTEALTIFKNDFLNKKRFAGAFVDVRMAGNINGLQFIQEAWKIDPDLNVVVVTAYQDRSVNEIQTSFSDRFQDQWDYLSKPFTSGEITQKARQIVSSWNRRVREGLYLEEIRNHQQALISHEKLAAVGRLARSIGHDFGNLLQPLLASLELAKAQLETSDYTHLKTEINEMIETVLLGSTLCQDLLLFSQECPVKAQERETIFLVQSIHKSLRLLRHEIQKKDIQVDIQVSEKLELQLNESQLLQILINLLKNSLDALPAGGRIWIQGRRESSSIQLSIQDNGSGISAENLNHVFEPLFSTKGPHGNGIGLANCKQLIEKWGGSISIVSKSNQGATVSMSIPLDPTANK